MTDVEKNTVEEKRSQAHMRMIKDAGEAAEFTGFTLVDGPSQESNVVLSFKAVKSPQPLFLQQIGVTQEAALKTEGGVPWSEIAEERVVENAINIYASSGQAGRKKTQSATWACPDGWGIFTADVQATENWKNRGSFTHNTYAEGQIFDLSNTRFEEQKQRVRFDLDAAIKNQNLELIAQLEAEYRRLEQTETHFKSSDNFLHVEATANPSLLRDSRIRVQAKVVIFRLR